MADDADRVGSRIVPYGCHLYNSTCVLSKRRWRLLRPNVLLHDKHSTANRSRWVGLGLVTQYVLLEGCLVEH